MPATGTDTRRVALYLRPAGDGFAGYRRVVGRTEPFPEPGDVVAVALGLLGRADALAAAEAAPPDLADAMTGDLLVCTHGRRDACCGSLGTALALELLADTDVAKAGYQVGRTSHTGGHRFAPTAIVLPEGYDVGLPRRRPGVAGRAPRRPVEAVLDPYRGSTAVGSPAVQALEQVAFGDVGWGWLDWSPVGHRRRRRPGHGHGPLARGRGPHLDGRGDRPHGAGPRLRQAPRRVPARPAPNPSSAPSPAPDPSVRGASPLLASLSHGLRRVRRCPASGSSTGS